MRTLTLALITTSILALPACGDIPEELTTLSGGTDVNTTTATTEATANPTSTTGPDDTTTGVTTSGASDSTTEATTDGTTAPTTGVTGETSTTTEPGTTTDGTTTEPVDTTTDGTTTDGTTTDGTTTDGTTTDGTTTDGTTGALSECAMLDAVACEANEACMPIGGGKLNLQKMCVGKPMFISCSDAAACGDALTYACAPNTDPPEPWLFPSTCLPEGWEPCEAPPIDMPCK